MPRDGFQLSRHVAECFGAHITAVPLRRWAIAVTAAKSHADQDVESRSLSKRIAISSLPRICVISESFPRQRSRKASRFRTGSSRVSPHSAVEGGPSGRDEFITGVLGDETRRSLNEAPSGATNSAAQPYVTPHNLPGLENDSREDRSPAYDQL